MNLSTDIAAMYNIRQFKPALYVLLLLGMTGFALAAQSPGLWVLGAAGMLLNAWLVDDRPVSRRCRGCWRTSSRSAPRSTSPERCCTEQTTPVMVIGQFLVLLQLIKLWEQRANRDYAQLLILSLLLMVAAAINTASLLFGVMLVAVPVPLAVLLPAVPPEGRDRRREGRAWRCRRTRSARRRCGRTSATCRGRCGG